jgi:hypothetical protein
MIIHGKKRSSHLGQLGGRSSSDLLNSQRRELSLELVKLLEQVGLVPVSGKAERVI